MYKKSAILWRIVTVVVCGSALFGQQKKKNEAPAPIPGQIFSAKSVFISNSGASASLVADEVKDLSGNTSGYYDQFYAGMKNWDRYQLVSTPSEAELVFEIFETQKSDAPHPDLHVRILDTKTKVVLWAFVEDAGGRKGQWNKALEKLISDVRTIATPTSRAVVNQ